MTLPKDRVVSTSCSSVVDVVLVVRLADLVVLVEEVDVEVLVGRKVVDRGKLVAAACWTKDGGV